MKNLDLNNFIVLTFFSLVSRATKCYLFFKSDLTWTERYQSLSLTNYYIHSFGQILVAKNGLFLDNLTNNWADLSAEETFIMKVWISSLKYRDYFKTQAELNGEVEFVWTFWVMEQTNFHWCKHSFGWQTSS